MKTLYEILSPFQLHECKHKTEVRNVRINELTIIEVAILSKVVFHKGIVATFQHLISHGKI